MILRYLAVRHFKGIERAQFVDLSDRLNLFRGPNEAGKTTLVDALHFGLFESASGVAQHKQALETWGRAEAPEVTIDLDDDDGERWRIIKRFLHAPSTELAGRNAVYRGREAERRLRAMLGTARGNRHGVSASDLGIWPLLWVRQGQAGAPIKRVMTDEARSALQQTLSAQTGALAAGRRVREVRDRLRAWVEAHRTPTGRPRGPLAEAEAREEEAAAEVQARREALEEARRLRVDALTHEARLQDLERRVEALQASVATSEARQAQRTSYEAGLGDAEVSARAAARALADARDQAAAMDKARAAQAEDAAALGQAEPAQRAAAARFEDGQRQVRRARDGVEAAEAALQQARAQVDALTAREASQARGRRRATLLQRLDEVRAVEARLREVDDALRALPAARDLEGIQRAEASRQEAIRRRPPVTVALRGPDGVAHEVVLHPDRPQAVEGWTLTLRPSAHPDDPATSALHALRRRLDALGLSDVEAVHEAAARRRLLDTERTRLATRHAVLAPDGAVALEEALAALGSAEDGASTPLPSPEDAMARRQRAEEALEGARRAEEQARATEYAARKALGEAERGVRDLRQRMAARDGLLRAAPSEEVLAARVAEAEAQVTRTTTQREALAAQVAEAEARQAEAASERLACERLVGRRDEARATLRRVQTDLARARASGPWTAWQQAGSAHRAAAAQAEALRTRVEAAERALAAVETAWADRQARLAGPVRQLVLQELPALFPGSEPAIDEDGDLIGLRTGQVVETFDSLSAGSREQLGVLLRLAMARVLGQGRRLPVLLDDALVHSDPQRRARVVSLLRRASADLQIVVFTSHDDDFDRLAADRVFEVRGRPARGG